MTPEKSGDDDQAADADSSLGSLATLLAAVAGSPSTVVGKTVPLSRGQRVAERYEVVRLLGRGGMGVVYEVFDHERHANVALKLLQHIAPDHIYNFKREFRALADLHHPNLVRLYDLAVDGERWFFTLELLDGVDFLSFVRPNNRLDERRLRTALVQLVDGLMALHAGGHIHRDVKPGNVMVTRDDRVVVLDCGLAREIMAENVTEQNRTVGTPLYMAPEQTLQRPCGAAADFYAVGVMLYEALVGDVPFGGALLDVIAKKQTDRPAPPKARLASVPSDLSDLCVALLAIDPAARPDGTAVRSRVVATPSPSVPPVSAAMFVGRDRELDELATAFKDSLDGDEPVVVVIEGESGVGKTALERAFLDAVQRDHPDATVLAGRCHEHEHVPYKAFDGVIDALSRHLVRLDPVRAARLLPRDRDAAALTCLFPVLRRVPVFGLESQGLATANQHELRRQAFTALRELMLRLRDAGPLVIAVDDLQWSDADSHALLDALIQAPDAPALMFVGMMRPSYTSAALPPATRRLRLGGLAASDAVALATDLGASAESARRIASETRGHPLFVQELALRSADSSLGLDALLRERIRRRPDHERALLATAALATTALPQQLLADAAGIDAAALADAVSALSRERLLSSQRLDSVASLETYHDRVRETVVADLEVEQRRRVHAQLADALERSNIADGRPDLMVDHLAAAGDDVRAAGWAVRAAERSALMLAFDQAVHHYQTALRLGQHDPDTRRALQIKVAETLGAAGRWRESAELHCVAATGADPHTNLHCRAQAAHHFLIIGAVDEGLALLKGVFDDIGETWAGTPGRALRKLLRQRIALAIRGLRFKPRTEQQIDPNILLRIDTLYAAGVGFVVVDTLQAAATFARQLRLTLAAGEPNRIARALAYEAVFRAFDGKQAHVTRSRALLAEVERIAQAPASLELRLHHVQIAGSLDFCAAEFRAAIARLRETETLLCDHFAGSLNDLGTIRMMRLWCHKALGEPDVLARLASEHIRDAIRSNDAYSDAMLTVSFNCTWLARDDVVRARSELARLRWRPPAKFPHMGHIWEVCARGELALYDGASTEELGELETKLEAQRRSLGLRLRVLGAWFDWMRGRLAVAGLVPRANRARARTAKAMAQRLAKDSGPFPLFAHLLEAALAREAKQAIDHLRAVCDQTEPCLWHAVAKRAWGTLVSGSEGAALVANADEWMRAHGIRNPARIMALYAPGISAYDSRP